MLHVYRVSGGDSATTLDAPQRLILHNGCHGFPYSANSNPQL
ncbi:hypothetical protein HMPREF9344_01667 [Cutibacterium acnes HL097PA1]|nr:hypothetical protein HMPREF9344_01667 [Cutibacterium acnes HL097PA1]